MMAPNPVVTAPVVLLLIGHIVLCLYLIALILLKRSLRDQVTHWFIINALISHLLFSLVISPGTINYEVEHLNTAQVYCRVYILLHLVEQVSVPLGVLMYTVDRMIYVRNPDAYGQKMSMPVVILLLVLPWGFSVLVGLISAYGYSADEMVVTHADVVNNTVNICGHSPRSSFYYGMTIFEAILMLAVALISLIVTVLVLCFFFRYKRALSFSQAYSQLEAEVMSYVRDATIIVCLLNLVFLMVFVTRFLLMELSNMFVDSHTVYFVFELFVGILFLTLSTDIRRATSHFLLCSRKRREGEQTTLRYVANAEEAQ